MTNNKVHSAFHQAEVRKSSIGLSGRGFMRVAFTCIVVSQVACNAHCDFIQQVTFNSSEMGYH